ncbi:MAG: TonB-dependent receptor, partial [Halioglobus sp.]|nr:TonB-dependent receptor [Halioglobus sp.]
GKLSTTVPLLPTDTGIDGHTLNVEWAVNDSTTLRSITAWRELQDKSYLDFSSGSAEGFRIDFNAAVIGANAGAQRLDLPASRPDLQQEQFSQEFQLLGDIGQSLQYMTGIYYFREEAEESMMPTRHIFSAAPFAGGTIYNIGTEYNEIDNDAWAFFSQMTWTPDILDRRLHLTLGWRHSEDSRDAVRRVTDQTVLDLDTAVSDVLPPSVFAVDTGDDYSDDSFTFIAEFDWTEDLNVYAKLAEAYKSGGFNIRDPDEEGFADGFEEEKLRAVEVGFKGDLLRMLRFNAALFHQRFDDFQWNFQIPGTIQGTRVFNIDEGEMTGLELELMAMPLAGLFLQASYAYTDSELDDIFNPFTMELQTANFGNAPKHTYSLVMDYAFPGITIGELNLNASYNFVDDRERKSLTNYRHDYDLVNARLALSGVEAMNGEWTFALWGKNLQDSDYETFTLDNLPQADRAVIWGDGRSYGLDITYRYR